MKTQFRNRYADGRAAWISRGVRGGDFQRLLMASLVGLTFGLGGCLRRHVSITSEPSGALVSVNDVEVGRTPCEAEFSYYGVYDVRLEMDGYEVKRTPARASAPIYEYPPLDAIAGVSPIAIDTEVRWHFVLTPTSAMGATPAELEEGLLSRARTMRETERPWMVGNGVPDTGTAAGEP
ncbi:MAG: PEGA domain-containing protein [Phycisphaerales bacterium]